VALRVNLGYNLTRSVLPRQGESWVLIAPIIAMVPQRLETDVALPFLPTSKPNLAN